MKEHVIPAITSRLGKYWEQPCRSLIEVDDTHALMTEKTFNLLLAYDSSDPSGVYEGKMWRRNNYLCWYGPPSQGADKCTLNYREILIV